MGSIYLAEHVTLGKRMAVKVLRPEYSRDAELLDRFQHEARAASQIGQENIVEVFDFGHTPEGEAYFVMEALDGESLARILHRDGPCRSPGRSPSSSRSAARWGRPTSGASCTGTSSPRTSSSCAGPTAPTS